MKHKRCVNAVMSGEAMSNCGKSHSLFGPAHFMHVCSEKDFDITKKFEDLEIGKIQCSGACTSDQAKNNQA